MSDKIITFGCRLNDYESEAIKEKLAKNSQDDGVHNIIFNSCAVTKEAERQLRQSIRKHSRSHPDSRIIVTGCAAQISPDKYAAMPEVDFIFGNNDKFDIPEYINSGKLATYTEEKIIVNDIMSVTETASHLVSSFESKTRAFVQIQNGCNHRCTFCIIPFGRGNSRSVPMGEIVEQIKILVGNGCKEVVLTGVDISDYGLDLPGKPNLGQMVKRLLKLVPELPRLRLSSIDVAEINDDTLDLIENEPRFMPYLHISLQAGDDMILKRMKRRHNRQEVLDFCSHVRKLRPNISFGADIIAGFPTETDEMFENTLNLVKEAGISFLHTFPYSEREGTPAAKMPQVPVNIRKERAAALREVGKEVLNSNMVAQIGKELQFIVEGDGKLRSEEFYTAKYNGNYHNMVGEIIAAKVVGVQDNNLVVEI